MVMTQLDPVKFVSFVAGCTLMLGASLLMMPQAFGAEISHAYSKMNENSCLTLIVNEDEAYSQQVCKGYDGMAVFVSEGDLRQSVSYGKQRVDGRYFTFGNFNRVGNVMEWRLAEADGYKQPFATILRWYVSIGEKEHQALVVTKIAENDFCIAGFVEATANKNANVLARQVADDIAAGFDCDSNQPRWHGKQGPLSRTHLR